MELDHLIILVGGRTLDSRDEAMAYWTEIAIEFEVPHSLHLLSPDSSELVNELWNGINIALCNGFPDIGMTFPPTEPASTEEGSTTSGVDSSGGVGDEFASSGGGANTGVIVAVAAAGLLMVVGVAGAGYYIRTHGAAATGPGVDLEDYGEEGEDGEEEEYGEEDDYEYDYEEE